MYYAEHWNYKDLKVLFFRSRRVNVHLVKIKFLTEMYRIKTSKWKQKWLCMDVVEVSKNHLKETQSKLCDFINFIFSPGMPFPDSSAGKTSSFQTQAKYLSRLQYVPISDIIKFLFLLFFNFMPWHKASIHQLKIILAKWFSKVTVN